MDRSKRACWPVFTNGPTKDDSPYIRSGERGLICQHDISEAARDEWLPFQLGGSKSQCVLRDIDSRVTEERSCKTLYIKPEAVSFALQVRRTMISTAKEHGRFFIPWFYTDEASTPLLFELPKDQLPELTSLKYIAGMEGFDCYTARQHHEVYIMTKDQLDSPEYSSLKP